METLACLWPKGCSEPQGSYGLCVKHENLMSEQLGWKPSRTLSKFYCKADGCVTRIRKGDIWCRIHFKCAYKGCSATTKYAKGLCAVHYQRTKYEASPRQRQSKYTLCDAKGCPQAAWRGRRTCDDGKEWEVRWLYAEGKQYCSLHRPKFDTAAPPKEVFTKEWTD